VQVAAYQLGRTGEVSQYQARKGVIGTMGLLLSIGIYTNPRGENQIMKKEQ